MGSAELQLAARVEGVTQADVREALWARRELAKTWTTRGTLHLHPADELSLWTSARRAVVGERDYEVDGVENVGEVVAAIDAALRGRRLLREELADAVADTVGSAPREKLASGWGYYLGDAATAGVLCFGPPEGQKVTFVHVEDWLVPQRSWEPQEALLEVARRYAITYGPAGPPPVPRVVHLAQLHERSRARGVRADRRARCGARRGRFVGAPAPGVRPVRDGLPRARGARPAGGPCAGRSARQGPLRRPRRHAVPPRRRPLRPGSGAGGRRRSGSS